MEIEKQRNRVSGPMRWACLAGGATAIFWGIKRRSWLGTAAALAGANFAVRGLTGEGDLLESLGFAWPGSDSLAYGHGIKVRRSVTIAKSPEELYHYWRNLANLPGFMRHLESVRVLDNRRSHWVAQAPAGRTIEWDAEIVADREGELIGWRSTGGMVDHAGSVRFERAAGDRGTVVRVQLQYNPPGGKAAALLARAFGQNPDQQIHEDLRHFKELMEAGEVPVTEGQPSGRAEDRRRRLFREQPPKPGREAVEVASEESFPASDAPSWTAGGGQ
jgi:uncharacterized membrane protein